MIVTEYVCDRCGRRQKNSTEMWGIEIRLKEWQTATQLSRGAGLWCRPCCDELQLHRAVPPPPPGEPAVETVTVEQKLIAVMREVVRLELEEASAG